MKNRYRINLFTTDFLSALSGKNEKKIYESEGMEHKLNESKHCETQTRAAPFCRLVVMQNETEKLIIFYSVSVITVAVSWVVY